MQPAPGMLLRRHATTYKTLIQRMGGPELQWGPDLRVCLRPNGAAHPRRGFLCWLRFLFFCFDQRWWFRCLLTTTPSRLCAGAAVHGHGSRLLQHRAAVLLLVLGRRHGVVDRRHPGPHCPLPSSRAVSHYDDDARA
eukprot:772409-Rhodomonas_salina.1